MKPVRMLVALAVVCVLAVGAGAQEEKGKKRKGRGGPGLAGMVEKVDGKTLTIRTGRKNDPNAKTIEVTVDDKTKYAIVSGPGAEGRKDAALSDVAVGKRVRIQQNKNAEGKEVVVSVGIIDMKPKK